MKEVTCTAGYEILKTCQSFEDRRQRFSFPRMEGQKDKNYYKLGSKHTDKTSFNMQIINWLNKSESIEMTAKPTD